MSRAEREAFLKCWEWMDSLIISPGMKRAKTKASTIYPDSPLDNVREIVVAYLKDNGYDGLCNPLIQCECFADDRPGCELMACCEIIADCRPGVLVDGKIVEREEG